MPFGAGCERGAGKIASDHVDARERIVTCGRVRASRHAERVATPRGTLGHAPGSGETRRVRARGAFEDGDAWLVEVGNVSPRSASSTSWWAN